jgi:hypothetical protein
MNKALIGYMLAFVYALAPVSVCAAPRLPFAPTDAEVRALPVECKAKLLGTPQGLQERFERLYGAGTWEHLHHYCFALNFMNRARFALDNNEKRYDIQVAINNYDYVLSHWPHTTPLIPKVQAMKAQAEAMLKMP